MMQLTQSENYFDRLPKLTVVPFLQQAQPAVWPDAPVHETPVATLLAVGAVFTDRQRLHPRDTALLCFAIECAREIGLPVSKQAQIGIVNLHDGHDYRASPYCIADIVALCAIPASGGSDPRRVHPSCLTSSFGNEPYQWEQTLAETQPALAVSLECYRNMGEVTVWNACPPNYKKLFRSELSIPCSFEEPRDYVARGIVRADIAARLPSHFINRLNY